MLTTNCNTPSVQSNQDSELDHAHANDDLEQQAGKGIPWAAYLLGLRYMEGHLVPRDCNRAFSLLRLAADAGHKHAALALGELHRTGQGTEKNKWRAISSWSRSLPLMIQTASGLTLSEFLQQTEGKFGSQNHAPQESLGNLLHHIAHYYLRDDVFPKPYNHITRRLAHWGFAASRNCLRLLHDHGDLESTYHLAFLYLRGKGVLKMTGKGLALLEQAATGGHQRAAIALGTCYFCGIFNVEPCPAKGEMFLRKGLDKLPKESLQQTMQLTP